MSYQKATAPDENIFPSAALQQTQHVQPNCKVGRKNNNRVLHVTDMFTAAFFYTADG